MRHEKAYARRDRAVSFRGLSRTLTISLSWDTFEQFEAIARRLNIGNGPLGRHIILKFLEQEKEAESKE